MPFAISLAKLSHPGEKPTKARAARVKVGSFLATQHGYEDGTGLVMVKTARSSGCAERAVISNLTRMLDGDMLESGTLLILDDLGCIPRYEIGPFLDNVYALIRKGMPVLTMHYSTVWTAENVGAPGAFFVEAVLSYADDNRSNLASARARYAAKRKKEKEAA